MVSYSSNLNSYISINTYQKLFNNHPSRRPPTAFTVAERFRAGGSTPGFKIRFSVPRRRCGGRANRPK